jgi:hypothetical protein
MDVTTKVNNTVELRLLMLLYYLIILSRTFL